LSKYVAFLRGINVGGHKTIKMDELKEAFEANGFKNVKTFLASGNVLFDAPKAGVTTLAKKISNMLDTTFGKEINVIIRTINELQKLADQKPFNGIKVTPQKRLYVTFLAEKPNNSLEIPYESFDGNFKIIAASKNEVFSILTLSSNSKTVDLMNVLEKEFGQKITTRNWNSIKRILETSEASGKIKKTK
jgi:uncharacterized protein (DUF1697 family)